MSKFTNFLQTNEQMICRITSDVSYNISDVIRDDYRAINQQFKEDKFSDGTNKEYFNVSRVYATAIKAPTDIDTKDLGVHSEIKEALNAIGVIRGVLRHHLKVNDYGTLFNQVRDELIDFGHVILKKTKDGTRIVDLRNVIRPAHIMDIQKSGICEKHQYSYQDMLERKARWAEHWEDIERLWEKMQVTGDNTFTVYEFWTIDEFDGQITKGFINYLDNQVAKPDEKSQEFQFWAPHIELEREKTPYTIPVTNEKQRKALEKQGFLIDGEMPMYPYDEQRFLEIKGRWKGAGVYEITAPIRRAYNKTLNDKLHYDDTYHKGLYVHTKGVGGKSLTQAALNALENSGVVDLQQGASLEQLRMNALTTDFILSADKFFEFGRQLLGLTAQGTGEELPASMSATSAAINQQRSKTLFDAVIEMQSLLWKRWFANFELSDILENLTYKKWVKIYGDENELREALEPFVTNYLYSEINKKQKNRELGRAGILTPTIAKEDLEATKNDIFDRIINKAGTFIEFTKELAKQSQYYLEFYVNNESFDKINKIQTLMSLKADALTNPNSGLNPAEIENELLDLLNLDPNRFKKDENMQLQPPVAPAPQVPQLAGAQPVM